MKKTFILIAVVLLINFIVIAACVKDGIDEGDMMLRFHERQAITFLSALMLGLASLIALVIFLLKRKAEPKAGGRRFWALACLGFFYLCMDEYFMAHEGMDDLVAGFFGKDIEYLNLDNLVIAFFGLLAFSICVKFRKELIRHKVILPFLIFGAAGLAGTVVFHGFERVNIALEVTEESFKIVGVSFFFVGFLMTFSEYLKGLTVCLSQPKL